MGTAPSTSGMADDGDTGVTGGSGGAVGTAQYHRNGAACDDASDVAGATDGGTTDGGDAAVMSGGERQPSGRRGPQDHKLFLSR